MTSKDVYLLDDAQKLKARLRETKPVDKVQKHVADFKWDAASGAVCRINAQIASVANNIRNIYDQLPDHADPMPGENEFLHGMEHCDPNPDWRGKFFHPVCAFQNRQWKYIARFRDVLKKDMHFHMITEEFPDMRVGGIKPMSDTGSLERLADFMDFEPPMTAAFLSRMIMEHNSELRIVGQDYWRKFSASATGGLINQACFWHYQMMNKVIASIQDILDTLLLLSSKLQNFVKHSFFPGGG